ncbi:MAG: NlpC/P60 family protein [Lachnospiraceae bacterium]|nr:NlpC/P60 family protein [Lachnospiraceae bacterium]MBQ4068353.1 C40 family peptidase [Lachnospiraceae bacterium]
MKGKILGVSAVCACSLAVILASSMSAKAYNGGVGVASAGVTAMLDKYYENNTEETADIVALLTDTVAQGKVEESTEAETEKQTEKETEKATKKPAKKPNKETEKQTEKETDYYDTIAVSQVYNYVNVRKKPTTESEIVGKIYNNCAATIIKETNGWYKIESGNVKGYIKSEYFITGDEAEAKALEIAHVTATVTCPTLNVREGQGTDTTLLTQLPQGGVFDVEEYGDEWVYICVDGDIKGWVSMEFVKIDINFDTAITLEEEQAKLEEERKRAEEAAAAAEAARQAAAEAEAARQAAMKAEADKAAAAAQNASKTEKSSLAKKRQAVVAFALQYVGCPYVYGGNSLTNGTDCSGFTSLVYANFGYSLNRVSSDQQYNGIAVSLDELQPGDILLYSNGGYYIGHAAIYIGNGQVVHASTPSQGIIVSNAFYRTPVAARRIIY